MRTVLFRIACIVAMAFMLVACNGNGPGGIEPPSQPQHYTVSGKVEKGPLVSGSTISMQLLDDKMQPTGAVYNTVILDDVGSFTFGSKEFDTPYADLTANGYFFNEVASGCRYIQCIYNQCKHSYTHQVSACAQFDSFGYDL